MVVVASAVAGLVAGTHDDAVAAVVAAAVVVAGDGDVKVYRIHHLWYPSQSRLGSKGVRGVLQKDLHLDCSKMQADYPMGHAAAAPVVDDVMEVAVTVGEGGEGAEDTQDIRKVEAGVGVNAGDQGVDESVAGPGAGPVGAAEPEIADANADLEWAPFAAAAAAAAKPADG